MTATMALYWIDVFGWCSFLFFLFAIASVVTPLSLAVMGYWGDIEDKDNHPQINRAMKFGWLGFIFFVLISLFTPSKNTMYLMLATHYAGESQLPEKVLKAIEIKLDEIIGDE